MRQRQEINEERATEINEAAADWKAYAAELDAREDSVAAAEADLPKRRKKAKADGMEDARAAATADVAARAAEADLRAAKADRLVESARIAGRRAVAARVEAQALVDSLQKRYDELQDMPPDVERFMAAVPMKHPGRTLLDKYHETVESRHQLRAKDLGVSKQALADLVVPPAPPASNDESQMGD